MRFAACSVMLPDWSPGEAVAALARLGYEGVEWRVTDQPPADPPGFWAGNRCTWPAASFPEDAARIRALTEAAGLVLPAVGTYVGCGDLPAVERAMRGVAALGSPMLRVNVPKYDGGTGYLRQRERARAQYGEVAALARAHGVRALVELHHGTILPSASAAAAFLDGLDPRWVGAIHDAGNLVHEGHEPYRLGLEALGPYLAHVHVKNARWVEAGRRAVGSVVWRAEWAPLAEGQVDLSALFGALRSVGYDGWVSLEDFSGERPTEVRLREGLALLRRVAAETGAE